MSPFTIALLFTFAVGLVFYAFLVPRSNSGFRITGMVADDEQSTMMKVLGVTSSEIIQTLPANLAMKLERQPGSSLQRLIQRSGNPWKLRSNEFFAVQFTIAIIFILVGAVVGYVMGNFGPGFLGFPIWIYMALFGLFGYSIPKLSYKDAAKKRDIDFKRQLPDALDLLIISLSSGATFPNSLREALPNMRVGVLRDELREVSNRLDSGRTLSESLTEFAERSPSENITAFVRAVQEATELNVPLIEVLESRAEASRQEYFALLQQRTASLESKMMAVLTPTLVPALLISVIAPSIAGLMSSLG